MFIFPCIYSSRSSPGPPVSSPPPPVTPGHPPTLTTHTLHLRTPLHPHTSPHAHSTTEDPGSVCQPLDQAQRTSSKRVRLVASILQFTEEQVGYKYVLVRLGIENQGCITGNFGDLANLPKITKFKYVL